MPFCQGLLVRCREKETRYLVRTLGQHLRIGAVAKTVLAALAQAIEKDKAKQERAAKALARAYSECPSFDILVAEMLQGRREGQSPHTVQTRQSNGEPRRGVCVCVCVSGGSGWERVEEQCILRPGTPIRPQLGQITRSIPDLLKRYMCGDTPTLQYGKPLTMTAFGLAYLCAQLHT